MLTVDVFESVIDPEDVDVTENDLVLLPEAVELFESVIVCVDVVDVEPLIEADDELLPDELGLYDTLLEELLLAEPDGEILELCDDIVLDDCDEVTLSLGGGGVGSPLYVDIEVELLVRLVDRVCVPEAVELRDIPELLDGVPDSEEDLLDETVADELAVEVPEREAMFDRVVVALDVVVLELPPVRVSDDVDVELTLSLLDRLIVELTVLLLVRVMLPVCVTDVVELFDSHEVAVIPLAVELLVSKEDDVVVGVCLDVELLEELIVLDLVPVLLPETESLDVDVLEDDDVCVPFPERVELIDDFPEPVDVRVKNDVNDHKSVDV